MKIQVLDIPELKIITPERHGDNRGSFEETFNRSLFAEALGLGEEELDFVQHNQSLSVAAGTLRGLHFQAPPFAQGKLVRVLVGAIYDVAVDIRRSSPTFGQWAAAEISAHAGNQIWVPPGFLHGFMTLVANVCVSYKVTAYYDRESEGNVLWSDPDIGIDWPKLAGRPLLSARDATAPRFADLIFPFDT